MIKKLLIYFIILSTVIFGKEVVKVGYPIDFMDMYMYKDLETSEYKGVYVDILNGYLQRSNRNLKFDYKSLIGDEEIVLGESVDQLKNYEVINTPFSYRAILLTNLDSPLKKSGDILGMNIGYVKGQKGVDEILNRNKDLYFEKIGYESENQAILALKNRRVDAIVLKNWNEKNPIEKKFRVLSTTLFKEKIGVNKNNPQLYEELKEYISTIPNEEIRKIVDKNRVKYYKYLLKDTPDYEKVKSEYESIKVELLADEYYLPFYYKENGRYQGLIFDILKDMEEIFDVPIEVVGRDGNVKGIYVEKVEEKEYHATKPYYKSDIAVAAKGTSFIISDYYDLDNSTIIIVKNRPIKKLIKNRTRNTKIIEVETLEEGVEKLISGSGDYLIDYSNPLISTISNKFVDNQIKIVGTISVSYGISMGIKSGHPELENIVDIILSSYSIEEITGRANRDTQVVFKTDYKFLAKVIIPMLILMGVLGFLLKRALENKRKAEKLGNTLLETMLKVNQLKETESGLHAKRVALHTEILGRKLGLSESFILKLKRGAILHDIGKVIIPGNILNKKGKLTAEEFELMKKHADFGYELATQLELGDIEKNGIRYHHEKWNGKGYPLGLKGADIPLEGRILGIIDAYDSMREEKIYKKGLTHMEAVEIIKKGMGQEFDPDMVKVFLENETLFEEIYMNTKESVDLVMEYYNTMKNR